MSGTRSVYRATVGAAILLGLGILVLVNYIGSRRYIRFDWTRSGLYTLSGKTLSVLKDLKTPVQVTVFMVEGSPLLRETRELLSRYQAKSALISVETIDPVRNRARAEALVKEYGIRGGTVVFRSGDRKKYVTEDQLAQYDFSRAQMGGEPTIKAFKGEQEFTSAILSVTQTKTPKVLFTTGHGERPLEGRDRDGFYVLAETLRRDNCTVSEWASLGAAAVPDGTDCVVVAGPRTSFTGPERAVLAKYLDGGGRALFFLDVEVLPGSGRQLSDFGLGPLLLDFGVNLGNDIVVDPKNALPMFGADTLFARSFKPHPITKLLEGSAVVFPAARSVGVVAKPPAGLTDTVLVETSADGWGETDLKHLEKVAKDAKDVPGPVPLAVAVEGARAAGTGTAAPPEPPKKTRLVVFGDADFASNGGVANAANLYLLTGSANWVMERESLIAIPPRPTDQLAVTLTQGDIRRIALVVLLVLPACAVALGLAIWVRRRS
ncbi:MAG: GldG family protein [Acidithiobacillales bacterium]